MNRYQIIVILFLSVLYTDAYAQSGLRPAGRYEVADTTIEVYNVGEFNTIREFKTIHGTNIIHYREFNKLTKKLREEGEFKNGYSSGVWKFYGWTGRLKREVNYDGQVKTYYVKNDGDIEVLSAEAALFDFEKYKQDSAFVANYRKNKNGAVTASKQPTQVEPTNGVTIGTVNIGTVNIGSESKKETLVAASAPVGTGSDSTKQKVEGTDSTKQKAITGLLTKLNVFKKSDTKKEEIKIAATDSAASKPTSAIVGKPVDPKKENAVAAKPAPASGKPAEPKKETPAESKPAPVVASKPAEPKKETPAPAEKKPAPAVVSKPVEPKKETPAESKPAPVVASKPAELKKETPAPAEKKPTPAVVSKPVEPKKETPAESKPAPVVASKPAEPKKETSAPAEKKPAPAVVSKPVEPKKETPAESKPAPVVASKPAEPKKETPAPAEKKPAPAVVSKPVEPKKEAPVESKPAPVVASKPAEPKKETPAPAEKKPAPAVASKPVERKKEAPAETKQAPVVASKPAEQKKEIPAPTEKKPAPAVVSKPAEPKKENAVASPGKKEQVLTGSMDQGKSKTTNNATNNASQKTGGAKQVNNTVNVTKPSVTVENKQAKLASDTASKKIEDALAKKLLALKKENDRMERDLKNARKKDSLHTDSIKRGLIKLPLEQKEKTSTTGASK